MTFLHFFSQQISYNVVIANSSSVWLKEDCYDSGMLAVLLRLTTRRLSHGNCYLTPSRWGAMWDYCMGPMVWSHWCTFTELWFYQWALHRVRMYEDACMTCVFLIYLTRWLALTREWDSGFVLCALRGWVIECPLITFHVERNSVHPCIRIITLRDEETLCEKTLF